MKRFYKVVSYRQNSDGFEIFLDGKPVKTSSQSILLAPNEEIADLTMKEWAIQEECIDPETMPFTQIISTKIDHVLKERAVMEEQIFKYLDTDLICYFHDGEPAELLEAQKKAWHVWLDWFEKKYAVTLQTTQSLQALKQPEEAHKAVRGDIQKLTDDAFTILQMVVPASGSLILSLAFTQGEMQAETLFEACHVEELFKGKLYNEEQYGADPAQEKKDISQKKDFVAAQKFLASF